MATKVEYILTFDVDDENPEKPIVSYKWIRKDKWIRQQKLEKISKLDIS